jgi:3-dehydro-4-phosphotetronate decarboxylase
MAAGDATELELREALAAHGRSLAARGLSPGTSGNLSVRLEGGFLVTPTNASLGALDPGRLSRLDGDGRHLDGDPPTKEVWLHARTSGAPRPTWSSWS